jgi:ferredoxin-NADP reductase
MHVTLGGSQYRLRPGESVLDGLTRHGVRLPSSCRAGVCQSCLMRAVSGEPGIAARHGIQDTLRAEGYFLACASHPDGDLDVALAGDEVSTPARLGRVAAAGARVLRVWLEPEEPLPFRAGQYVTLQRRDGLSRSYSIANLPRRGPGSDDIQPIELHVRQRSSGAMSTWLTTAPPGTRLRIRGPAGHCFYLPGRPRQPLVLAGTGTGIAPLAAVARDAVGSGHTGPISIVHGAASTEGLYLHDELQRFAAAHPAVRYQGCVLSGRIPGAYTGDIVDAALAEAHSTLGRARSARPRGFLCGGSGCVRRMRRALFLAGFPLGEILADEFLPGA